MLREIKARIQEEQLRMVMAVNSATVLLYWDIGLMILEPHDNEDWSAWVIAHSCFFLSFRGQ